MSTFSSRPLPALDDVRTSTPEVDLLARIFVRARVSIAQRPFAGTLERLCTLTPYAAELIADDALRAGRGSRLEVMVAAADGEEAVSRVRARFAILGARGVNVVVRGQLSAFERP
jgi:hypothetical protein